ncbi:hypothetical protein JTB14_022271 [Gonioctena quinquepunctata]|nr:hypothetical protein JTB14_022271 [Gonioctena quinquepunctata]
MHSIKQIADKTKDPNGFIAYKQVKKEYGDDSIPFQFVARNPTNKLKTINMAYMTYFIGLCVVSGIGPPSRKGRFSKMYSVIMLCLTCIGYVYSSYGKIFIVAAPKKYSVVSVIEAISDFLKAFTIFTTFILFTFVYPDDIKQILKSITSFDAKFKSTFENSSRNFWSGLFLYIASSVVFVTTRYLTLIQDGSVYLKWILYIGDFQHCQIYIEVYLYFWLANEIRSRFEVLKDSLKDIDGDLFFNVSPDGSQDAQSVAIKCRFFEHLGKISKLHHNLCDVLNGYNKTFGHVILLYVLYCISNLMKCILNLIYWAHFELGENLGFRSIQIHLILKELVTVLALAAVGESMKTVNDEIAAICYDMIHSLNLNTDQDAKLLKERIRHLVIQVISLKPSISAAGFFVVDFTLMGVVIPCVASYIIVAIQFMD